MAACTAPKEAVMPKFAKKEIFLTGLAFGSVLLLHGCSPSDSSIPAAKRQVSSTYTETRKRLERIQQHGLIDLEVQQQLEALRTAYRDAVEQSGNGPADWNALSQVARSAILLDDARQRGTTVAFGLTQMQWSNPELQDAALALMPNSEGGGWVLEIDGSIRELDAVAYETATLAGQ
jgi:hypothetical protein